jgi:alpha-amylase
MKSRALSLFFIPFLLFYGLPVGAVENEERKWQDESIYFLMIDRFNDGDPSNNENVQMENMDAYHGGDFQGIIDRLDYIKEMGFTSIMLSPIFANADGGYHGYWVNDFYQTEEHFGNIEMFKELVEEAHKIELKVIVDFPVQFVGSEHPWVTNSQKKDWLKGQVNEEQYEVNLANEEVQMEMVNLANWWIQETKLDGYFIGTVDSDFGYWRDFSVAVKKENQDFILMGNSNELELDIQLNTSLVKPLRNAFEKPDKSISELLSLQQENEVLKGNYVDNHLTSRFTREIIDENIHPGARWKLTLAYMFTTPGVPIVFYGSEIALDGGDVPDNYNQMDFRTDKELIEYLTKLGELRDRLPSLTKGTMELVKEENGVAVYKREFENEVTIVALNNTSKSQSIAIPASTFEADKELRGLLAGDLVREENEEYTMIIDREEAEVYVLTNKSGLNIPYLVTMGIVYSAFIGFLVLIWKRARRNRSEQ